MINYILIGNVYEKSSKFDSIMSFFKFFYYLIVFFLILAASYYLTRYIAKKSHTEGKYIKLIETFPLGKEKNLHIISIGEEFFLISSSIKEINLLARFSGDEFENMDHLFTENKVKYNNWDSFLKEDNDKKENIFKGEFNKFKNFFKGSKIND